MKKLLGLLLLVAGCAHGNPIVLSAKNTQESVKAPAQVEPQCLTDEAVAKEMLEKMGSREAWERSGRVISVVNRGDELDVVVQLTKLNPVPGEFIMLRMEVTENRKLGMRMVTALTMFGDTFQIKYTRKSSIVNGKKVYGACFDREVTRK